MEKLLSSDDIKRCADFDENYKIVTEKIAQAALKSSRKPEDIILLAATKTVPSQVINYAVSKGITHIGENRVQEYLSKYDQLEGATRHFIGHLQKNKVRRIVGKVSMIESVDSVGLAAEIGKISAENGITTDILLEVNIGMEESKSGFSADEIFEKTEEISKINGINIQGLMCIPPIYSEIAKKCSAFEKMQKLFIDISGKKIDNVNMRFLSMGMSGDYDLAIGFGANIVRIGRGLFGERN